MRDELSIFERLAASPRTAFVARLCGVSSCHRTVRSRGWAYCPKHRSSDALAGSPKPLLDLRPALVGEAETRGLPEVVR